MSESLDSTYVEQGQDQKENIWDKIENITETLNSNESLSHDEKQEIASILNEIYMEQKKSQDELLSFFNEKVSSQLKELFPKHPLLQEDVSKFPDSLDLLVGGEAFERIIDNIENAKNSIMINIFIWRNDNTGREIGKKLLEAANRGVEVTIVKDRLGGVFEHAQQTKRSFFHTDLGFSESFKAQLIDSMYKNGEEPDQNPFQQKNEYAKKLENHQNVTVKDDNIRNDHSKYYIFDNETLVTGGMNIGDEYRNKRHDYMVESTSPLMVEKFKERVKGNDDFDKGSSVEVVTNRVESGTVEHKEIESKVLELLESANKSITIEMAYFGDRDIINKIIEKANGGVPVDIVIPKNANIQDSLNKSLMNKLLKEAGDKIDVYLYPDMLHAKMIHVDGQKTFLGSANLNKKATEDLGETNMLINDKDAEFTQEVIQQLEEDKSKSKLYSPPPQVAFSQVKSWVEDVPA